MAREDLEPCDVATISDDSLPVAPPAHLAAAVADVLASIQTASTRPLPAHKFITVDPETVMTVTRAEALAASLPHNIPVLITGASGTGKELIAEMFIVQSKPFVAINCAALPETLATATLFGHKRGAFTGAINDEPGAFIAAGEGVVFLDEIGDMPLSLQPLLLRVLQERKVTRVGENVAQPIRCRIVAATNKSLVDEVAAGRFREDLLARLDMITLSLKPLYQRECDAFEIGKQLGLIEDELKIITGLNKYKQQNVRALQAFAARKKYLGDPFV